MKARISHTSVLNHAKKYAAHEWQHSIHVWLLGQSSCSLPYRYWRAPCLGKCYQHKVQYVSRKRKLVTIKACSIEAIKSTKSMRKFELFLCCLKCPRVEVNLFFTDVLKLNRSLLPRALLINTWQPKFASHLTNTTSSTADHDYSDKINSMLRFKFAKITKLLPLYKLKRS